MRPRIEQTLRHHLPLTPAQFETPYNEALEYALFPGGKRLRPALTLLGAGLVGGRADEVMDAAVAVEFIHTSSLVFDDLPCMDDASERCGRASVHRRYGDGVAILVALGLLNAAYGIVLDAAPSAPERARRARRDSRVHRRARHGRRPGHRPRGGRAPPGRVDSTPRAT
jgi:geranylgeranyl pyrophosphate synthase